MAGHLAAVYFFGPLINADRIRNTRFAVMQVTPQIALTAFAAQAAHQLFLQLAFGQAVNMAIDCFVEYAHGRIIRILQAHPLGNFFGRSFDLQFFVDIIP